MKTRVTRNWEDEVADASALRNELRALLIPFLSRTERGTVTSSDPLAGTQSLHADPSPQDFGIFRHLVESFDEENAVCRAAVLVIGSIACSISGPRYAAWKRANIKAAPRLPRMTRERRNTLLAPRAWPDAKLRALGSVALPRCCRYRGSPHHFAGGR